MENLGVAYTAAIFILFVGVLMFVIFELQNQRDFYRDLYCMEVLQDNPNHSVCGERE